MKVLIVEDDVLIAEHLRSILTETSCGSILLAHSFSEAEKAIDESVPDLVLLDIQLNSPKTGIDLAHQLSRESIPYIFITAQSDPTILSEILKTSPDGYILKPFRSVEVKTQVQLALQRNKSDFIFIEDGRKEYRLKVSEIMYLKSDNNYVEIFTTSEKFIVRNKLSKLMELLPSSVFLQTHRSYIVNSHFIRKRTNSFVLIGEHQIPVSKSNNTRFSEQG